MSKKEVESCKKKKKKKKKWKGVPGMCHKSFFRLIKMPRITGFSGQKAQLESAIGMR